MELDASMLEILSDLREIEAEIERLKGEREALRIRLSEIVATHGNRVIVPGFGTLAIRAPSVSRRWDGSALDELMQSLRETGQGDIADEILACKKSTMQPGGLAITLEKRQKDQPDANSS